MCCKADDEGRLPPGEEDNAAPRKIGRKGWMVLELIDYMMLFFYCKVLERTNFLVVLGGTVVQRQVGNILNSICGGQAL
ncbi:MAG: hypothetical protein K0S22_417 [Oscillospiraceae bacterium]|nr:hypothetical protein [Oscillospiraceae bacterium]